MTADLDRKGTIVSLESIQDGEIGILDSDVATPGINGDGMPRQFNWLSTLGISFSITNSWAGYMVSIYANAPVISSEAYNVCRATLARSWLMAVLD